MAPTQNSLVLVTVDCLRADHCGFHGYSRPTTPFLDSLAKESFVIPTAVIAGAPTYHSLPAILASRMPLSLGRDVLGLAPGESTLATALRQAGYATAAFSAANPYISARFGFAQGFEVFQDFLDFDLPATSLSSSDKEELPASANRTPDLHRIRGKVRQSFSDAARALGFGSIFDELYFQYCLRVAATRVESIDVLRRFPSAEMLVDRGISWLTSVAQRPFFLWLHLMDPHSPYYPPPAALREFSGREMSPSRARYLNEFWNRSDPPVSRFEAKKDSILELYDAGIRFVDSQVARLVAHLQRFHLWDRCLFVLTADHGEEFLDHGRRYHAPLSIHEEISHVPLLLRVPAAAKTDLPAVPFSHLHLAPTLLRILSVPQPSSFHGTSLWRALERGTPWEDLAITECSYGCVNPFPVENRMGSRLLSVRNTRYKLLVRIESDWGADRDEEFYDLAADPKENHPLPRGTEKNARKKLMQAAYHHLQQTIDRRDPTLRLRARLRSLRQGLQSNSR